MAVLSSSGFVESSEGCEGSVGLVLDSTNFYAEQGGQVADIGSLASSSGRTFDVQDTQASCNCNCMTACLNVASQLCHVLHTRCATVLHMWASLL